MKRIIILVALGVLLVPSITFSKEKIFQSVGEDAAIRLADGMIISTRQLAEGLNKLGISFEKSSRNLPLTFNTFALYLEEYWSDDPEVSGPARRKIRAIFPDLEVPQQPKNSVIEATVIVSNVRKPDKGDLNIEDAQWEGKTDKQIELALEERELTVDIVFIDNSTDLDLFKSVVKNGHDYKGEKVSNTGSIKLISKDYIENKIQIILREPFSTIDYLNGLPEGVRENCERWANGDHGKDRECVQSWTNKMNNARRLVLSNRKNAITKAILQLTENNIRIPANQKITRAYSGGKYAVILIPEKQYELQKDMVLYFTLHEAGHIDKRVGVFKHSPIKIKYKEFVKESLPSDHPLYPKFRYKIIGLRLTNKI